MSDIGTARTATVTCADCGAQNDLDARSCADCGRALPRTDGDERREVRELEEVWRGVAAAGFDDEVEVGDGRARCPACGTEVPLTEIPLEGARPAVDTATSRDDLLVAAWSCAGCGNGLRGAFERAHLMADGSTTERLQNDTAPTFPAGERAAGFRSGAAPETPVGQHPERFDEGGPGTLADQGPLTDAEGEDIRHYTGEPVETEDGWVIPGQQNLAGKDNIAGGGEWPDPDTPPVQPEP
jgi:hypothetical protein